MFEVSRAAIAVVCVFFLMVTNVQAVPTSTLRISGEARIGYLDGEVKILPKGSDSWRDLEKRDLLRDGDEVKLGKNARLEIVLVDNSKIRFAEGTRFKLIQVPKEASENTRVHLLVGRTWVNVRTAVGVKKKFEVACDNAVAGIRGTVYRMNVHEDKSALIRVYEGEVAVWGAFSPLDVDRTEEIFGKKPTPVEGPKRVPGPTRITMEEWTVLLKAMQEVSVSSDGKPGKPRIFTDQEDRDDWVEWNRMRDRENR
ncbi:MAG: FecR family protein [Syntrophales bacterium]|nr:FecR family protein [Syntrophales bacterium]